jgi:endothelin-converting enzyme/putative endopeptidase
LLGCASAGSASAPVQTEAASAKAAAPAPVSTPAPLPPPLPFTAGLDEAAMDPNVDPCEDFFQYACGGWLQKTEIPGDRPAWGRMAELSERNETLLREILDNAVAGKLPPGTAYVRKVADFYATCMDEPKLEDSLAVLQGELKKLARAQDAKSLATVVADLHLRGMRPLFHYNVIQDFKNATQVIAEVDQGGLGLPDRDYYVKDDAKTKSVRDLYAAHVKTMFTLLGQDERQATQSADTVMELETALAKASLPRVERRNPEKRYNRLERAGLKKAAPDFPWDVYFKGVGSTSEPLNVGHPPFFEEVARLAKTVPGPKWRTYLSWVVVRSSIPALPKRFQDESFAFNSKALTGASEDQPRWKKCVALTDRALGEALGQPYVAQVFGEDGKTLTREVVAEVEAAFERNLDTLAWMDAPTKQRALEKIRRVVNKVGYPDVWRNYDALEVGRTSFFANLHQAARFEKARDLAKIGKPVDRHEWGMTPPTVNAYYSALKNEIVFPAGILQPPMFNRAASPPVNFGAMGMVVGHEFSHGFDDQGRKFDAEGNLNLWWTDASDKAFRERAACVEKQYSEEIAIEDIRVNGKLTLGENVADFGGVKLAFLAMREYLKKRPLQQESRFTPEQQFFLGYAQGWCNKYRPENARLRAATDPHSPAFLRVKVPLRNFKPFAEAFSCKAGSKMVKSDAERCEVW